MKTEQTSGAISKRLTLRRENVLNLGVRTGVRTGGSGATSPNSQSFNSAQGPNHSIVISSIIHPK